MTLLSKSAILCANDLQTEDVDVPEWGGAVRVRSFTGRELDAFEASISQQKETSWAWMNASCKNEKSFLAASAQQ
jgi:hypothetical protein